MHRIKIYTSPLPFPFNFAVHSWIVLEIADTIERYEIHLAKNPTDKTYFYSNHQPETQGMNKRIRKSLKNDRYHHTGVCILDQVVDQSVIDKARTLIESYPHKRKYLSFPGPNSNTFIQYIINTLDLPIQLPRNAFGKGYISNTPNS